MNLALTWCVQACEVLITILAVEGEQPDQRLEMIHQDARVSKVAPGQLGAVNRCYYMHDMPHVAFDNRWLVAVDGRTPNSKGFLLFDLDTGKLLQTFEGHTEEILDIKMSLDRKYAVTAAGALYRPGHPPKDATARLWDLNSGKEIMRFGELKSRLWRVYLSTDNQRLFTIGAEDAIGRLWNVKTGKQIREFSTGLGLSADGQLVFVSQFPDQMIIWDSQTGTKKLAVIKQSALNMEKAFCDAQGSQLLTYQSDEQPTLQTWDTSGGKRLQLFKGHTGFIHDACFVPNSLMIASASADRTIRLWNIRDGKELKCLKGKGPFHSILISGDGKRLYATWDDLFGNFHEHGTLWDLETGKVVLELEKDDFVGFSSDGGRFLMTQSLNDLLKSRPATWFDSKTAKAIERR